MAETNERRALRKALLALLVLHDECCDALESFHEFLLLDFEPLARHFRQNKHAFIGTQCVVRERTEDGRAIILLPEPLARVAVENG